MGRMKQVEEKVDGGMEWVGGGDRGGDQYGYVRKMMERDGEKRQKSSGEREVEKR